MFARLLFLALVFGSLLVSADAPAQATREHTVRSGQSLARIARRYEVSVANLAAANRLGRDAALTPGQVLRIPEAGTAYVGAGDTLSSIARANECSVEDLRRLNRLSGDRLQLGQRLILPGFVARADRERAAQRWGRPRRPGRATFFRRSANQRENITLVDRRGRARRPAINRLRELMRTRDGRPTGPPPPARLIEILARTSDHFGGRMITIVSGYRPAGGYTRESSRHLAGQAVDIRIQGVPNEALRDYLRENFTDVGVGYYPRSSFIHLDVRDRTTYWVDWSGRGEAPRYQRRGEAPPEDATEEELERVGQ